MRRGPHSRRWPVALFLPVLVMACSRTDTREYPLSGQIIAVDPSRQEVTIKHEDIPSFMPGMTMAFKVTDGKLLEGRVPGDLVKATLVIEGTQGRLRTLDKVGHAALREAPPPPVPVPLGPGEAVTDATLVDEHGAERRLSDLRGSAVAVTFIYTRCPLPNFCPLMDRHFKAVQDLIRADPTLKGRARLLSVSFDPAHDTPEILAGHAAALGADPAIWQFLTGPPAEVDTFASQFGVSVIRDDPREIAHNLRTAVITPEGRLATVLRGGDWTPAELAAELTKTHER